MSTEQFSRPGAIDLAKLAHAAETHGSGGYVMELVEAQFEAVAAKSVQHPVVVEFYSPRDPGGVAVSKALADEVNAAGGKMLLARVNVDEQPRVAQALGVQAVPTVVALLGGQLAPLFQGTKSSEEIKAVLAQVAQVAVANGMTGRAEPVVGEQRDDAGQPSADPRFAEADAALEAADYAKAVEEFDKLLADTPGDIAVIAGRAQAALLQRSTEFDPAKVVAEAGETDNVDAQLRAADLEVIQGANEQALERLLQTATEATLEDRERIRVRILELFEVIGRTEPVVLAARRRLTTLLF